MVAPSHGERPPLHVVPSTSPVPIWRNRTRADFRSGLLPWIDRGVLRMADCRWWRIV
jgi:hypothetical protein